MTTLLTLLVPLYYAALALAYFGCIGYAVYILWPRPFPLTVEDAVMLVARLLIARPKPNRYLLRLLMIAALLWIAVYLEFRLLRL